MKQIKRKHKKRRRGTTTKCSKRVWLLFFSSLQFLLLIVWCAHVCDQKIKKFNARHSIVVGTVYVASHNYMRYIQFDRHLFRFWGKVYECSNEFICICVQFQCGTHSVDGQTRDSYWIQTFIFFLSLTLRQLILITNGVTMRKYMRKLWFQMKKSVKIFEIVSNTICIIGKPHFFR